MSKEEELTSDTDPGKAEDEEYRNFKEEPGDDDGENRNPDKRSSTVGTGLFVTKAMIGSGLLNVPFIFRTFGIIYSIIASFFLNFITVIDTYFLLRCKDITQRYSYAVYSKLTMGLVGTITCKICVIIRSFSLCCVLLKILGKIIRTLLLIFFNEYKDRFFLNSEFLLVVFALLITPMMLQKDISGVAKFTFLGIYSIGFLFVSLVILFIFKIIQGEIKPLQPEMLYSSGDFFRKFKSFGSYLNAYLFQVNVFPIYLPLHPRNTKNMLKATIIGATLSMVIYLCFGAIGFIIYRYDINDTLLTYLGDDLIQYLKTNKMMAGLLILFEIAFIANTTISTMLNFFTGKSGLIAFVKFILKNIKKKGKENNGIPLVEMNEQGDSLEIKENLENEDILSDGHKTVITLLAYIVVIFVGYASQNIISIDNFNGSTVNNYLSVMLPALFFIILSRKSKFSFEKFLAIFVCFFSISLITGFLLFNFTNIFG
jgi:amino acid permease